MTRKDEGDSHFDFESCGCYDGHENGHEYGHENGHGDECECCCCCCC